MFGKRTFVAVLMVVALPAQFTYGGFGSSVAVIDEVTPSPPQLTRGQKWCALLENHGHPCTLLPVQGPPGPLDAFDVVVDLSGTWTDPTHVLADFMRAGKTVVTVGTAPARLGIASDPLVRDWIGADHGDAGESRIVVVDRDPILGPLQPGSDVTSCNIQCVAVYALSERPNVKILAHYDDFTPNPLFSIAVLRTIWEGGVSACPQLDHLPTPRVRGSVFRPCPRGPNAEAAAYPST